MIVLVPLIPRRRGIQILHLDMQVLAEAEFGASSAVMMT